MNKHKRIWEIDFLRGIAVILMIIFHLVFDLNEYFSCDIEYLNGFWYYIGKFSAILFIVISGISVNFGKNSLNRGINLFLIGMLLTVITYIINNEIYINFGILHFLGLSMVIYYYYNSIISRIYPSIKVATLNIATFIISVVIIIIGNILSDVRVENLYLFPLGLTNATFKSLDFYPLLPWFGLFLIGALLGKIIYKEKKSVFRKPIQPNIICYAGQKSLIIYLIHQPIILFILYILHIFLS